MAIAACFGLGFQSTQAQGTRNNVIVEVATGTWCTFCPGAAMGVDDLHASGANVGIVEHHDGDNWETVESAARYGASYYGVTGFPTAWFDGQNAVVGGSHTQSLFNTYNQKYNTAIAAATPFNFTSSWAQNGNSVDVTIGVSQVGAYSGSNLRVQAVVVENHIQVAWQGQTEISWVNRDMAPDQNGTAITTTMGGPAVTTNLNIPINASWDQNEMYLVTWVEDGTTKMIYNGKMEPLATAQFNNDPAAVSVLNAIGTTSCISSIAPEVNIRNMGANTLTSVDFSYNVNGGTPMTYTWSGNVPFYSYATVTLPSISFTPAANNTLTVSITNSTDNNMANNTVTKTWMDATTYAAGTYNLTIVPDDYGSETTWEFLDGSGSVLASGGPYTDGNTTPINETVNIGTNDCFTFVIYDAYGDGICCSYGNGSYLVTNASGGTVASGGQFGSEESSNWKTDGTVAVDNSLNGEINIFPNPSNGIFNVEMGTISSNGAEINVMTLTGQRVFSTTTSDAVLKIDLGNVAAGMYMVQIKTAEGVSTQKITKK